MGKKYYIITGIVAYILFLLITVPAAPIIDYLQEQSSRVHIQGISGTLWDGRAQRIAINSDHILSDTKWSFIIWRLITGELGIDLDTKYTSSPVSGSIGIDFTGNIVARDIKAEIDARTFGNMVGLPFGELSGSIALDLEYAHWNQGTVPATTGTIKWQHAAITVTEKAELGTVNIILYESDTTPLVADINNKGGQLKLSGKTTVTDDGKYSLELKLLPNADANSNLRSSLALFAKKQSDGNFVVKNTGNLKQLGLM